MSSRDLDSILEEALDAFDEAEITKKSKEAESRPKEESGMYDIDQDRAEKMLELKKMMDSLQNPEYGDVLHKTMKSLSVSNEGNQNVESLFTNIAQQFGNEFQPSIVPKSQNDPNIKDADRTVAATLQMIGRANAGMEGFEPTKMEDASEQMMDDMMRQFEELGEKEDYNEVIDNVMRQLLSKDLMYDPSKMICAKFPEWLALHKAHLSEGEYTNYGKMYQSFQKLLAVYDTEPDNFPRIMELMYDMQQYGQPPADIIRDLAPGLKFDENGMPIMPNMGAGILPEDFPVPGGDGLPSMAQMAGQMGSGQCMIM